MGLNYELNRWHSLDHAGKEDIEIIGPEVRIFEDYINQFRKAREQAKKENRLKNAATYNRVIELLVKPESKNTISICQKFVQLFDQAMLNFVIPLGLIVLILLMVICPTRGA